MNILFCMNLDFKSLWADTFSLSISYFAVGGGQSESSNINLRADFNAEIRMYYTQFGL